MKGLFGWLDKKPVEAIPAGHQAGTLLEAPGRSAPPMAGAEATPYVKNLLYEADPWFNRYYQEGMVRSQTPDRGDKRRERFYNLVQLFRQTQGLSGDVVECGCWRGLSSYLLCNAWQDAVPGFDGRGYHIFDSFEGLSEPRPEDVIQMDIVQKGRSRQGQHFKPAGAYDARQEEVAGVLEAFPKIAFVKGWLPQSLEGLPERQYRFVHVDVDLYEPTKGAVAYFYQRLVPGGIIVCDDYGSLLWPGAKQALDEYAAEQGIAVLSLSSGQGVLFKR